MLRISGIDDLRELLGKEVGVTEWHLVTQQAIDDFAEATQDSQWIHVDPDRARSSSFGTTIAHGLYTLSLGPRMMYSLISFDAFPFALHYGYERVRFPAPLPVDARVRMRATLTAIEPVTAGIKGTFRQIFEADAFEKPVCVAEHVILFPRDEVSGETP